METNMKIINDHNWNKLSSKTKRQVGNIFKNCNSKDFLDHAFEVFFQAKDRGEIKGHDVWRLTLKALHSFNCEVQS